MDNKILRAVAIIILIALAGSIAFAIAKYNGRDSEETSETMISEISTEDISEIATEEIDSTTQETTTKVITLQKIIGTTAESIAEKEIEVDFIEEEPHYEIEYETATRKAVVPTTSAPTTVAATTTEAPVEEEVNYAYSDSYPEAAYVWNYMRGLGWSDAVCAGILGNIMAEVGGNTLDIYPYAGGDYYGICQWYLPYHNLYYGASLDEQLNYLANSIATEMNAFGSNYYSGFGYSAFLSLTDPGDAAYAFAVCYERCASWAVGVRSSNAWTAYNYFA